MPRRSSQNRFGSSLARHTVATCVVEILKDLSPEIRSKRIDVELDLDDAVALDEKTPLAAAIRDLIVHAIQSTMPTGCISITLIDANYQWELEVTDTSDVASRSRQKRNALNHDSTHEWTRPKMPMSTRDFAAGMTTHLRNADRSATCCGGQIELWDCPQGGAAYVLVVPKKLDSSRRATA